MGDNGHGVQIVRVLDDHTYQLDEGLLSGILLNEEVKDLPVVVVSVAGAYRRGKSFLLNFFLRYLTADKSSRDDGSWLGSESEPLAGFSWRSGIKRNTTGILMWSKPFITNLPSGEKVAVLLMDTQGTFDNTSTVRDCSTIFALSTLTSSVLIYNLSFNIQEDDLQHLQLFNAYGKLMKEQGSTTAFQVLEFLVRDWAYPFDYPYGFEGGNRFLADKLAVTPNMPKELVDLRKNITSSFEQISCFLMPHPGFNVLKPDFKGEIKDIDISFRTHLKDLVSSLFGPGKLMPKKINGEQVKARDLFTYFQTYMNLFNSDQIFSPTTIMEATTTAGFLSALNEAREVYEKGMELECGPTKPSLPAQDVKDLHSKYLANARAAFKARKTMGSQKEADKYLENLTKELEDRLPQYGQSNLAKTQSAIMKGRDKYDQIIQEIAKNNPLCVHPKQLVGIHENAVEAAVKIFDADRKRISNKKDEERETFIKSFEKKLSLLRLENERNNQTLVVNIRMKYWELMETKCNGDTPLSEAELKHEHDAALNEALQEFNAKRSIPNSFTEDVYKFNLIKLINEIYRSHQIKNHNKILKKQAEEQQKRQEEERRRQEEERRRWEREWRRQQEERQRERERKERERQEREQNRCAIL